MDIKIGCDPEIFLYNKKSRKIVSAAGKFPGTKKEPFKLEKGAVQVDGVALEFNIEPASSQIEFLNNINTVKAQLTEMVTKVDPDLELSFRATAYFNKEDWDQVPDENKELGCDPDYECYEGKVKENPTKLVEGRAKAQGCAAFRTASGHIHIGWVENENPMDPLHFEDCRACAAYFDRAGFAHSLYPFTNEDYNRLYYYGGAGAFRPKPYGVELRSPGPTWAKTDAGIIKAYNLTKHYFDSFAKGS